MFHSPRGGYRLGGGIATFVPVCMTVNTSKLGLWHVYTFIELSFGSRLHLVNAYLPPMHSSTISCEEDMWGDFLSVLGSLPSSDASLVVGDLNAHLEGHEGLIGLPCPCGSYVRQPLSGTTCSRGERLFLLC